MFVTGLRVGATVATGRGLPQFTASLSFRLVASNLTDFLANHGLWRPLPNTGGWEAWDRSMGAVFSPRGIAGLYLSPGEDQIVDLCAVPGTNAPPNASPPATPQTRVPRGGLFAPAQPRESWLRYEAWLEVEADSGTSVLRAVPFDLPRPDPVPAYGAGTRTHVANLFDSPSGGPARLPGTFGGQLLSETVPRSGTLQSDPQVTVKPRAAPLITVYLNVRANRVGFPVPCPALFDKAGKRLQPDLRPGETAWVCKEVGCLFDQTVYGAWGRLRYTLPSDVAAGLTLDDLVLYNPLQHNDRTG